MDPFMNQGDQLDQGGKVEVEIFWWNLLVEKLDQTRPDVCQTKCQVDI